MEIPKVYKALRVDNGVLKSVWAGNPEGAVTAAKGVVYKENQIAYAPKGQQGLSTFDELPEAINFAESQGMSYPKVVHEAVPLGCRGEKLGSASSWGETAATYPAILLGKEVWRDEPKVSEENALKRAQYLLGGDIRTCTRIGLHIKSEGRSYSLYVDGDAWVLYEGSRGKVFCTSELIRVADFIDQDTPKEEWVDVTKECELRFLDNYPYDRGGTTIEITHCGSVVTRLGIGQPTPFASRYKVVEITHNYLGQMSTFKILKKVVK